MAWSSANERAFAAEIKDANGRCHFNDFTGLRAAADGEYDRALPLLLAAADGPSPWQQAWAMSLLTAWHEARLPWTGIAKRRIL